MEPGVLYEDGQLLVVNKPAGMIVYPDGVHDYPALSHWLEKRYGEGNFHFVHRIDRETSGALLVARDEKTHEFLQKQFKNREVQKTYRAFVMGTLKTERGMINKPIGSSRGSGPRSARQPVGTERDALTIYKTLTENGGITYVEVFPKTGRTHQIRVHFAAIGHPIIADVLYGRDQGKGLLGFERLALHAFSLRFTHPNGQEMLIEAPLPQDFSQAEKRIYTRQ